MELHVFVDKWLRSHCTRSFLANEIFCILTCKEMLCKQKLVSKQASSAVQAQVWPEPNQTVGGITRGMVCFNEKSNQTNHQQNDTEVIVSGNFTNSITRRCYNSQRTVQGKEKIFWSWRLCSTIVKMLQGQKWRKVLEKLWSKSKNCVFPPCRARQTCEKTTSVKKRILWNIVVNL